MKKKVLILSFVSIIGCWLFVLYSTTYRIEDNKKQLEDNIKQFINKPTVIVDNIDIKQEINIDNKKYILFISNNTLGEAELTKGLNSKYKIEYTGSGGNNLKCKIHKTNKGKYLILKGENYDMKIAYAKIILDNKEYKISIPQQKYFLAYCLVPTETEVIYPGMSNNFKLYNSNDVDITNEMLNALL